MGFIMYLRNIVFGLQFLVKILNIMNKLYMLRFSAWQIWPGFGKDTTTGTAVMQDGKPVYFSFLEPRLRGKIKS
jgi:hypothetical protein